MIDPNISECAIIPSKYIRNYLMLTIFIKTLYRLLKKQRRKQNEVCVNWMWENFP